MSAVIGPGTTFGHYRIESIIGRGGMGVVYRATDLSLGRPVALKLIAPELAQDDRFRRQFLKEPRLAASLDHPNVIPIYEAGERDGQLYLAMRFVQGSDLRTLLERERTLTPERTLRILAQVAGALDAAHRRGLVHRDVKPANILLDEDEHAYLTDFGITKKSGGESTDTVQAVGTLDYLAPEQIRGQPVGRRSDGYALACVLYQCLTGAPPFRRATQAETLWAHLHDPPASLPGYRALDQVMRTALAKEKDERYTTGAQLVEAASTALGLAAPQPVRGTRDRLGRRGRRALLVVGLLIVAGTIAGATVLRSTGGAAADVALIGNGVAAIDPKHGKVASFIKSAAAPSNIAVGEGAVWVLDAQDRTVSRIDPTTKAVTGRIRMRRQPTDIAAGAGAVWVGNGGGPKKGNFTVSISRIDPTTTRITRTVKLSNRTAGSYIKPTLNWGFANIAVGAGAVWAVNPDSTLSRIDPETGRVVSTIDVEVDKIAAGREGMWFVNGSAVTQIDPRTNRPGQTIRIGTEGTAAIAVGGGAIWVTAEQQGAVWRIEPGPQPEARSIDVGAGVTYIAFGAGAVWAANYVDGTVARIDPRTNAVKKIPIGAAQALAAGAGSAWVSTDGETPTGELPDSACGELVSGGGEPDVLIASDLPLQGSDGAGRREMAEAISLVLRRHGFKAGRHTVGYRSCDDSTAQSGDFENRRCAANANAFVRAERLVAVIGPFNSYCAEVEIPILNRAPRGPVAMISPSNSYPGLTRSGPAVQVTGYRGEPDVYYPTGVRNYFRLRPGDDLQGAALAVLAKRLELGSVFLLDDGTDFWKGLVSVPFRNAAEKLGVRSAGSATFEPAAKSFDALATRVARSGAQGVVIAGDPFDGGDRVLKALRDRLGGRITIMGGFLFAIAPDVLAQAGRSARGVYATTLDLPLTALPLTATGRAFARDVGAVTSPAQGVLEAGQAAELVMAAIGRSDGTRASVLRELRASKVNRGILGSFSFDANGDSTTSAIPILRITGATPPGARLPPEFQGATVDRVLHVPTELVE